MIDPQTTVSELMREHPQVIGLFIKRKMLCVGCPSQRYHSLEDVARLYGFDRDEFLETITQAITTKKRRGTCKQEK